MDMKCRNCWSDVADEFKFCPKCGEKTTKMVTNANGSNYQHACDTFERFKAKKSQQHATFFCGKTKKCTPNGPKQKDVLINIGVMKYDPHCADSSNVYTPVRGKSLLLKIKKDANYAQLLTAALVKRKAYDQSFDEKLEWDIVYPDGQNASSLTGQPDTPFCLGTYKEDLGKNYSRLVLYLCTENSDENSSDMVMECKQDMRNNK
jgi:hypothetical protein